MLACEAMCWQGGVEIGVLSCIFCIFAGVRVVGGCVLARAQTQTTCLHDLIPGVGRASGEPEKSRSTKAQYTCRQYMCTQYICIHICWAVGFHDLVNRLVFF